jgi:hypothetical protein
VVIPDRYMADGKNRSPNSEASLGRQVTLVGVGDRVEIWNSNEFYAHLNELLSKRHQVQNAAQEVFGSVPPAESPQAGEKK